jgi:tRNA threonylcarbamoyladenosine biosynthesis protein TsaB
MALILSIETATKVCSVALALDGKLVKIKESKTENFSHSENLNIFIERIFSEIDFKLTDLDAIAVSMGPGSYTGLRIGVSSVKGLAYGLNIPVIGINSLQSLSELSVHKGKHLLCPMFDARRMEVYAAFFDLSNTMVSAVEAKVIESDAFESRLNDQKVVFLGPGAEKCQSMITHPNAIFELHTEVSAIGMIELAEEKFKHKQFENLAYFEPFYLKDFIAGKPKKLL